jgi:hypothetical protein
MGTSESPVQEGVKVLLAGEKIAMVAANGHARGSAADADRDSAGRTRQRRRESHWQVVAEQTGDETLARLSLLLGHHLARLPSNLLFVFATCS